ncbi:phosphate signaling complex protein PhoU [bacterium]|nr:phosphate signaling complex protein PhoU [bacterium]
MSLLLRRELELLEREILKIGSLVEDALNKSIIALVDRRSELVDEVVKGDDAIDSREVELDEECLKVLALHQPVAHDLRFVITVMKVNNDLERIGDRAVSIAERASFLNKREPLGADLNISALADKVRHMVRQALDGFVELDSNRAREVIREDEEVDNLRYEMRDALMDLMHKDPSVMDRAWQLVEAVRHLERVGDLAVHIAEEIIFLVDGKVIRHHHQDYLNENHKESGDAPL